ncbi:hypothetical protein BCR34DRAFT_590223 [Clohesyomyces aquaticus]|uniref:Uncharacterized protein n=1 Tax=Clohesyomyces aquaticus TaxID=1231657 RepID=A0A1Y1ZBW3_9PLEO|nr:hypothetical protein BCR34DRAFT_590223 [Clohesyomyces aquaticus]
MLVDNIRTISQHSDNSPSDDLVISDALELDNTNSLTESFSINQHRCGVPEISINPEHVEERLSVYFDLAAAWDAIFLIDHADTLLETKIQDEGTLQRNAMVSCIFGNVDPQVFDVHTSDYVFEDPRILRGNLALIYRPYVNTQALIDRYQASSKETILIVG